MKYKIITILLTFQVLIPLSSCGLAASYENQADNSLSESKRRFLESIRAKYITPVEPYFLATKTACQLAQQGTDIRVNCPRAGRGATNTFPSSPPVYLTSKCNTDILVIEYQANIVYESSGEIYMSPLQPGVAYGATDGNICTITVDSTGN